MYLAAKNALNEAWVKSDTSNDDLFTNPKKPYLQTIIKMAENPTLDVNQNKKIASLFARSYWDSTFVPSPSVNTFQKPNLNYLDIACKQVNKLINSPTM